MKTNRVTYLNYDVSCDEQCGIRIRRRVELHADSIVRLNKYISQITPEAEFTTTIPRVKSLFVVCALLSWRTLSPPGKRFYPGNCSSEFGIWRCRRVAVNQNNLFF